jgi:drug/metabolite transporter (DMT)-like permease
MSIAKVNNKTTALLSMLFVVFIWGSASTVTKLGVQEMPPFLFALIRNMIASALLFLFYLYRRKIKRQYSSLPLPWKKIGWMGLTGITFFSVFFNLALVYTSASTGALIQGFIPVAIVLPAIIFLKEKPGIPHIAGIVFSVAGVILIGFIDITPGGNSLSGNVLMILSVISWAVYTVVSKSLGDHDPVMITAFSTLAGTIFLVPVVVFEQWGKSLPPVSINAWVAILYLAIFSSTICFILYNKTLKILPAATVGNLLNLDPLIGAIIAIIALNDKITNWQIAGGLLILVGIVLSSKSRDKESKA